MNIAFFGSSLVSSYWNGAATYYRGLLKALAARGHRITFYESDAYDRQQHRDIPDPPYARVVVYPADDLERLRECLEDAHADDLIVKASGVGVHDEFLESAVLSRKSSRNLIAFWDVDAPATLDRLHQSPRDPFHACIPQYDLILTYGGGEPVISAYRARGARLCVPIYNALDPDTHYPVPADARFAADLAFLGNRLPDREARVDEFFFRAASLSPGCRFLLGGAGWHDKPLPPNVRPLGHISTNDHNALNSTPLCVLNISRESMARYGFSPATRVFEAAGAAACLITDAWLGIEQFLLPGRECLLAHDGAEVARHLASLTPARARAIGHAALQHLLAEHTYTHRAAQLEHLLERLLPTPPLHAPAHAPLHAPLLPSLHHPLPFPSAPTFPAPPGIAFAAPLPASFSSPALRIVILGLSITSSWGNGHATTYRGLMRELTRRGHQVLFLERDKPWYAAHRDLPHPPYGATCLYGSLDELRRRFTDDIRLADLVIVGSYVPEGVAVGEFIIATAQGLTAFYDIDTPITLAKLERGDYEYLSPELIPSYDLYLSFTGGPTLDLLETRYGAPRALPFYCSVDPELYFPDAPSSLPPYVLGYLGTFSADRQPTLDQLLLEPARCRPDARFVVAGPQYPDTLVWPDNVDRIAHLPPSEHRRFYSAQQFTLNITRADMIRAGFSPSVRLFEAAACGVPIISDAWPGLEDFFVPGRDILIARSAEEVLTYCHDLAEADRRQIAARARAKVLACHTAAHRAAELEACVRAGRRTGLAASPPSW